MTHAFPRRPLGVPILIASVLLLPVLGVAGEASAIQLPPACAPAYTSPWFSTQLTYTVDGVQVPALGSYDAQYRHHREYAQYPNGVCADVFAYCEVRVWDNLVFSSTGTISFQAGSHFAVGWYADFYDDDPSVISAVWVASGHYKGTPVAWPSGPGDVRIGECGFYRGCGVDVTFKLVDGREVEAEGPGCDSGNQLAIELGPQVFKP